MKYLLNFKIKFIFNVSVVQGKTNTSILSWNFSLEDTIAPKF